MKVNLNFRSGLPIYIQLMDSVKNLIASGELKPGEQLPTVRQLAADLRVNFNTVARAYRLLDEAGIISTQHGRGTYILEPLPPKEAEKHRKKILARLAAHYVNETHRLDYSVEEVRAAFEAQMADWEREGRPPPAE